MQRGRVVYGVGAVAVLAVVGGLVFGLSGGVKTPAQARADAAPPESEAVTVRVESLVLADRVVTRGSVESAGAIAYTPASSSSGGSRIEMLRAQGDEVGAGDAVALIDGRPVIVLPGGRQLAADLRPDSTGRDVELVQDALRTWGANIPSAESGTVGAATQAAIEALYEGAGVEAPTTVNAGAMTSGSGGTGETLELKLSRLARSVADAQRARGVAVAQRDALADPLKSALTNLAAANRRVEEATAARDRSVADAQADLAVAKAAAASAATSTTVAGQPSGSAGVSGGDPVEMAERALRNARAQGDSTVADAQSQQVTANEAVQDAQRNRSASLVAADASVAAAESTLAAAQEALADAREREGVVLPRAEVLFAPVLPTAVLQVSMPSASAMGASSGPLFSLRSGELVVSVEMPAGVRVGDGVSGVGETDDGSVTVELGGQAPLPEAAMGIPGTGLAGSTSTGSGGSSKAAFEIVEVSAGEVRAGLSMRVTLSAPVTDGEVVAVPVRAVRTGSDGTTFVVRANGDRVDVLVGRSGGGMVEVLATDRISAAPVSVGDELIVT